jgi:hypothetical protein
VDHRAGLENLEERKFLTLPGFELRPLYRPARSMYIYRLHYPGSCLNFGRFKNSLQFVQTGSEAHPASYPIGNRGFIAGVYAAGA